MKKMTIGRWRFTVLVSLIAVTLPAITLLATAGSSRVVSRSSVRANAAVESDALALAVSSGVPVEVVSETTESERLLANPDGTLTLEVSAMPARVRQGAAWVPVDTTLVVNPDGSYSPRAVVSPLVLSGGGSGPFVRFTRAGVSLAWSWLGALPVPVVSGDTLTYPEVLAGVDLRVTAQEDGFSEVLVVKTPAAAALPQVQRPSFAMALSSGGVQSVAAGGFRVLSANGAVVLASGKPLMWDSAGATAVSGVAAAGASVSLQDGVDGTTSVDQDDAPSAGDHVAALGETVTASSVSLTADVAMLGASSTVFPVFVDPSVYGPAQNAHAMVDKSFPTTKYYNWTDADQGVGFQNFSGVDTKRLFFRFPMSTVAGTHILSAVFRDTETHASTCTATPVELWRTGAFSSSTTWSVQPAWSALMQSRSVSYGRAGCATSTNVSPNDTLVEFVATAGVVTYAAARSAYGYFGLKAPSPETNNAHWKRFKSNAVLSINFNRVPNKPASLNGPGGGCAPSTSPTTVPSISAVPSASLTDGDAGDQLSARFTIYNTANAVVDTEVVLPRAQGTFTSPVMTVPAPAAGTTVLYHWQVYSNDTKDNSLIGGPCYYKVDLTAPGTPSVTLDVGGVATPPAADGSPYPTSAGTPLTFTFAPGGTVADTVKYRWSVNADTPGTEWLPSSTATTGGVSVAKTLTLTSSGPNLLRVWAYDVAGNQSGFASFPLTAPQFVPARWAMDTTATPSIADSVCVPSGTGPAVTSLGWVGTASSVSGHRAAVVATDKALRVTGAGMAATTGAAPVAGATAGELQNYTVSAWVHVDPSALNETVPGAPKIVGGSKVAFSVDGPSGSAMTLGIASDPGTVTGEVGAARLSASLVGTGTAFVPVMDLTTELSADNWYQVSVTVDMSADTLEVEVGTEIPGFPPDVVVTSYDWPSTFVPALASGALRLGSAKPTTAAPTTAVVPWVGEVDEVLGLRGAFLSGPDGLPSTQLSTWINQVPPFPNGPSPCS
jgi:hypothetical protein